MTVEEIAVKLGYDGINCVKFVFIALSSQPEETHLLPEAAYYPCFSVSGSRCAFNRNVAKLQFITLRLRRKAAKKINTMIKNKGC